MYRARVLVRNIQSSAAVLDFGEFTISRVGLRFSELRKLFASEDVCQDDWIFEKSYIELPAGSAPSPAGVGGVPTELEDILLLLRLYKLGDVAFVKQAIIRQDGERLIQFPYRAMNNLNSHSVLLFDFEQRECERWSAFANELRTSQSWGSKWFSVARRFFLYGGAKEFNPTWDDADRIVDYMTALEAAIVPEVDFSRRRISRRTALFVSPSDIEGQKWVTRLIRQLYDIRSKIVHGSGLSDENKGWLIENCTQIERTVRQVLVTAVQNVPAEEAKRVAMLSGVYDPADEDRGEFALQKFRDIRTDAVQTDIATKISRLVRN